MLRFIFPIILWTITVAQEENGIPCQKPYIENGQYTISGGLAKFSCNPGYVLNGSRISQCHYIGWYPHPPVCQEFACGSPPETKYGQYLPKKDSYKIGENVTYICFKNYMIYGDETVTCTAQGWSSLPSCEKTKCPPPPRELPNSELLDDSSDYYHLYRIQYKCKPNYKLEGSSVVTCVNGKWTPLPTCISKNLECGELPRLINGGTLEMIQPPYTNGLTVMYQCSKKYKLQGDPKVRCLNGRWTTLPTCLAESLDCGELPRLINGDTVEIIQPPYTNGLTVTYQCSEKYNLQGNPKVQCLNGRWTTIPTCLAESMECGELPRLINGDTVEIIQPPYTNGLSVTYRCSKKYKLQGNPKVQCLKGSWTILPSCLEPCTVTVDIMEKSNLELRWIDAVKIYVEHNEFTEFKCKHGYSSTSGEPMRVRCINGSFHYPTCIKTSCTVTADIMKKNNLALRWSDARNIYVKNNEFIEFKCTDGYTQTRESPMRVHCVNGAFNYPTCIKASCTVTADIMEKSNLELRWSDARIIYLENDEFIEFKCKHGYWQTHESPMRVRCANGSLHYPTCTKDSVFSHLFPD